jgi:serine/threonine protein kinase/Flp pilus assembly protein TadD
VQRPVQFVGLPATDAPRHGRIPTLPRGGDSLFGFRLRHELGRGAFACVFLAEQADLANRPVVLKISGPDGDEPQTLAQLQHTHIVPIYSVHEDAQQGLRAVCMPYFGGASLSRVVQAVWAENSRPLHGADLVRALKAIASPPPGPDGRLEDPPDNAAACRPGASPLDLLEKLSYVRAAAWIVARLAEALEHAHQRGVLHRDIKPSNVLLSADGQPMLLDFNLAQNLRREQEQAKAVIGGTISYMAPEQLRAIAGQGPPQGIDRRSDIYSLGIVLYEVLAGCSPFEESGSYSPVLPMMLAMAMERSRVLPSLRSKRPDVPWGLESIFRRCVSPDPEQRYQEAEQLAEDLRRFLDDRPLRYAPELSRVERVRKWVRRHPRLAASGSVALVAGLLLGAGGAALAGVRQHLAHTRAELQTAQDRERKQTYEAGTVRALCLVNTTTDLQDHLRQGVSACEQTLGLYRVLERDDWQQAADWQRLDAEDRQRLAEDARELLLLLAWARVRLHPGDRATLQEALALLDRAEAVEGLPPARALWEGRASYLEQLGEAEQARAAREKAEGIEPAGARDHYLLATTYARAGRYRDAVRSLDRALALNPRHYWSSVQRGICHQELGEHALAAADFGACVGLWPEFAWGYFNRGYVLEKSGHRAQAIADYTAALERDPDFVPAYLNRGLARLELKEYEGALADFDRAAALGRDDASLHAGRGVALEGLKRHAEADQAFEAAFAKAHDVPEAVRTRLHWIYGFAVAARLPDRAREAFDAVLRRDARHPQALYGRAMLLVEQGREGEAVGCFDRALEASPGFIEARRYRAVLCARAGQLDRASQDINWCLEKDPAGGATSYAAACVAARAAARLSGDASRDAAEQALAFLQRAFASGHGRDIAPKDPDLQALRTHPTFVALLAGKK